MQIDIHLTLHLSIGPQVIEISSKSWRE